MLVGHRLPLSHMCFFTGLMGSCLWVMEESSIEVFSITGLCGEVFTLRSNMSTSSIVSAMLGVVRM